MFATVSQSFRRVAVFQSSGHSHRVCKSASVRFISKLANVANSAHSVAFEKDSSANFQHATRAADFRLYEGVYQKLAMPAGMFEVLPVVDEEFDLYHQPVPPQNEEVPIKMSKRKEKAVRAFKKFLKGLPAVTQTELKQFSEPLVKHSMRNGVPYVLDPAVCRDICSVMGYVSDSDTAVAVANPGPGMLSREVIRCRPKELHLFEPNSEFQQVLQGVHQREKETKVLPENLIFSVAKCKETDIHLNDLLTSSEHSKVKMLHIISENSQFGGILDNYFSTEIRFDQKTIELYLVVPNAMAKDMFSRHREVGSNLCYLWDMFVDTQFLASLPATGFFPQFSPKSFVAGKRLEVCVFKCTFASVQSNNRQLKPTERRLLWIFTRHFMHRPSDFIVTSLEKWAPGIGLNIIRQGCPVFKRFRDLSRQDFLNLFFQFVDYTSTDSFLWQVMENSR